VICFSSIIFNLKNANANAVVICNSSTYQNIHAAVAYKGQQTDKAWYSKGWYTIPKGECKPIHSEEIVFDSEPYGFAYVYTSNLEWTEYGREFCIHPLKNFKISEANKIDNHCNGDNLNGGNNLTRVNMKEFKFNLLQQCSSFRENYCAIWQIYDKDSSAK
jgi:uncharacterized membrane protein